MMDSLTSTLVAAKRIILSVGSGDGSQQAAITQSGHNNIISTFFDSEDIVNAKYGTARDHIAMLRKKSTVLFQVDATKLHGHPDLKQKKFDIILFTFPHTGTPNCSPKSIEDNKKLIRDFLVSAQQILANDGEIILTLKTSQPYARWTFPSFEGYEIEPKSQHAFNTDLFPGYVHRSTKRTNKGTIVKNGNAKTFVFGRKRKRQDSDTEEDGDFQPLTSFKLHMHFLPFDDNDIESYVAETLSAQAQQKSINVLDIRCLFPEAIRPDTRQLNRVLYRMESAQMLRKGPPKACNQKPTWKLVTE